MSSSSANDKKNKKQIRGPFGEGDAGGTQQEGIPPTAQSGGQQPGQPSPAGGQVYGVSPPQSQVNSEQPPQVPATSGTSQAQVPGSSYSSSVNVSQQPATTNEAKPSAQQPQLTEVAGVKVYVNPPVATASQAPVLNRWRCSKCGTLIEVFYPIEKCPKCGASSDLFVDAD